MTANNRNDNISKFTRIAVCNDKPGCPFCGLDLFEYDWVVNPVDPFKTTKTPLSETLMSIYFDNNFWAHDSSLSTKVYNPDLDCHPIFNPAVQAWDGSHVTPNSRELFFYYSLLQQAVGVILGEPFAEYVCRHHLLLLSKKSLNTEKIVISGGRAREDPHPSQPLTNASDSIPHPNSASHASAAVFSTPLSSLGGFPRCDIGDAAYSAELVDLIKQLRSNILKICYLYSVDTRRDLYTRWRNDVIQLADRLPRAVFVKTLKEIFPGTISSDIRIITSSLLPEGYDKHTRSSHQFPPDHERLTRLLTDLQASFLH